MIPIPKELTPQTNTEYIVTKTKNNTLIMVPKISNPYKSTQKFVPAEDNVAFEIESAKELKSNN